MTWKQEEKQGIHTLICSADVHNHIFENKGKTHRCDFLKYSCGALEICHPTNTQPHSQRTIKTLTTINNNTCWKSVSKVAAGGFIQF